MVDCPCGVLLLVCGPPACGKTHLVKEIVASGSFRSDSPCVFVSLSFDQLYPRDTRNRTSDSDVLSRPDECKSSAFAMKEERRRINTCIRKFCELNSAARSSREYQVVAEAIEPCASDWAKFLSCLKVEGMESLHGDGRFECDRPMTVILDDNMIYSSVRHEYLHIARDCGFGLVIVYMVCSTDEGLRRNAERGLPVPQDTVKRMHEAAEPPNPKGNWWEANSIVVESGCGGASQVCLPSVMSLIRKAQMNPIPPLIDDSQQKEESRAATLESYIHQADAVLRKNVSALMQTVPHHGGDKAGLAKRANEARRSVLDELRTGVVPREDAKPDSEEFKAVISKRFRDSMKY